MLDLIAQGPLSTQRWRRPLPDPTSGREITLGRADSDWNVPWDLMISRKHVRLLSLPEKHLQVTGNAVARNPVFYRGKQSRHFKLAVGEHFVIGKTTFTFANRPGASDVSPQSSISSKRQLTEHAFDQAMLRGRNFRDAASRIEVLSRLPDLITSSGTDEELLVRMTNVLLQSTPSATAVAVVATESDDGRPTSDVSVLHYDSRRFDTNSTSVSAKLARSAIEKRESVLQIWSDQAGAASAFTTNEGVDWAFCVPMRSEACRGWAIYVTGQFAADSMVEPAEMQMGDSKPASAPREVPEGLKDDLKFAELVGSMVANLRQSHRLERRQASMRQFFAPLVMDALARRDPEQVLAPRETDLTVMFCDLRGFSRRSEEHSDSLLELLGRVSESLGLMTRAILDSGGVIGDFHGDAAMGFWGWPLAQNDRATRAAEAAMQIRATHAKASAGGTGFQHGIGIATGRAVAGQIGTVDQVKVTAFGPVVNLASRLEGLTKSFGVHVIMDQATANAIANSDAIGLRIRPLANVCPAGFTHPTKIFELVTSEFSEEQLFQTYEKGLEKFTAGEWSEARSILGELADRDRPSRMIVEYMDRYQAVAPPDWSGAIPFSK
ncbi:Adenylate cyclase 1 [Planctomycetes bacterium CA13]|uniref:Adenylate cyclase 1 n=1 Tax=Novipirellula herctigrandis TaxID=2527986 RepID=A0A5C5Z5M7_9BACT|nr:Adenylate cyclase 1 [Planctomycetes bacterium CA13]